MIKVNYKATVLPDLASRDVSDAALYQGLSKGRHTGQSCIMLVKGFPAIAVKEITEKV